MNPFELFDHNILFENKQTDKNSVHPDVDTTLEDTLLAEILDLDPLSPRKQNPIHTPTTQQQDTSNKENISPQPSLPTPKGAAMTRKVRKINPFYSPSKQTKSLVAKDTLRKQLQLNKAKNRFLAHQPTPPASSHSPSINKTPSNR